MPQYQDLPHNYLHCLAGNEACPRKDTCLRAIAARLLAESEAASPVGIQILNPNVARKVAGEECPYYRDSTPVKFARGMSRLFDDVPAGKLVLGIPFYSRMWKGVKSLDAEGKPLQMGNVRTPGLGLEAETIGMYGPDYTGLANDCIEKNGFTRYWDDAAKAPYLYDGSCFITYEDAQSIRCKICYAKETGLFGAMFWELRCDKTGTLLPAVREAMDADERGTV